MWTRPAPPTVLPLGLDQGRGETFEDAQPAELLDGDFGTTYAPPFHLTFEAGYAMPWTFFSRTAALVLGLVTLTACGATGPAYDQPASEVDAVVETASHLAFVPERVTVRVGDTVSWRNRSPFTHTVTADPARVADPGHVSLPEEAEPFDSGDLPPGGVFNHTFRVAGRYDYACRPHETWGMLGTVIVEPR